LDTNCGCSLISPTCWATSGKETWHDTQVTPRTCLPTKASSDPTACVAKRLRTPSTYNVSRRVVTRLDGCPGTMCPPCRHAQAQGQTHYINSSGWGLPGSPRWYKILITAPAVQHMRCPKAVNCHYYHLAPCRKLAELAHMRYGDKTNEGQADPKWDSKSSVPFGTLRPAGLGVQNCRLLVTSAFEI
jgi:hypothetical protein